MRLGVSAAPSAAPGFPRRVGRLFHRLDQSDQVARIARERRSCAALDREGAIIVQAAHDHRRVSVSGHEPVREPASVGRHDVVLDTVPPIEVRVVQCPLLLGGGRGRH